MFDVNVNSVLIEIRGAAQVDGYGQPTVPGAVLWAGSAPGYLKRARKQRTGELEGPGKTDTFTILRTALGSVLEQAGASWDATTVVILDQRTSPSQQRRFTVQGMEDRAVGSVVDSVKLDLAAETSS